MIVVVGARVARAQGDRNGRPYEINLLNNYLPIFKADFILDRA